MNTTPLTQAIQGIPSIIDNELNRYFLIAIDTVWLQYGRIIIAVLVLDAFFIILKRIIGGRNRMPYIINFYVGKATYLFLATTIYMCLYCIFGATVIDWEWFVLSCATSYPSTKILLRDILYFWDY